MDRHSVAARTAVAMPKASMYKDDFFQSWKDEVRVTGKVLAMESKAKTETVNY
jgi:hypothetical protein